MIWPLGNIFPRQFVCMALRMYVGLRKRMLARLRRNDITAIGFDIVGHKTDRWWSNNILEKIGPGTTAH